MSSETILYIILGIITFDFVLNQVLDYLNLKARKDVIPDEMEGFYDAEKYKKAQSYQKTNARFSFITSTISFVLAFILLSTGFFGQLDIWLRPLIDNDIVLALVYFGIIFIGADILNTPFQWYATFVIEEKYGFNKTTTKTFILDKLKGYMLAAIIGGGLITLLLYLIFSLGHNFWIYFWIAISLFTLFINMFYTSLILPLFNKLTPLEEGDLKDSIKSYGEKVNFPLKNIFVIDGSKRSKKSNAFFTGLGKKKKVVLYDTLIENHSKDELVAILAHEIGHYKKNHIIWNYVLSILQTGLMLYIMSLMIFSESLSLALGANQMGIHLNLLAFGILYTPISHITGLFMNILSRKNEYEADNYARETFNADSLKTALKKLSVDNLSNLYPHPAFVFIHYSHPPILKRLKALSNGSKENFKENQYHHEGETA